MPVLIQENERLTTAILGLRLANPVLVASGPLSDSHSQIVSALRAGAGGVVTKTIYLGEEERVVERVMRCPAGLFNSTTYSHRSLEQWLRILASLAEENAPVVASIFARRPKQLGDLARCLVQVGARALELGLCCPNDGSKHVADWKLVGRYSAAVCKAVDVPFSVKLAVGEGLLEKVKAALDEGAEAISLSDSLPSLVVDIKSRSILLGGPLGYSGPAIKPIVLYAIYQLRQAGITCPIFGIGGVGSASDVLQYLQVGASAVQLYTVLVTSGMDLLTSMIGELRVWCQRECATVPELVGSALSESMA